MCYKHYLTRLNDVRLPTVYDDPFSKPGTKGNVYEDPFNKPSYPKKSAFKSSPTRYRL